MTDRGWANFTEASFPYPRPGPKVSETQKKKKNNTIKNIDLRAFTRIDNGQ